jgi:hypothetical protein
MIRIRVPWLVSVRPYSGFGFMLPLLDEKFVEVVFD